MTEPSRTWAGRVPQPVEADHARVPPPRMWEEHLVGPGAADESGYHTRVVYPPG